MKLADLSARVAPRFTVRSVSVCVGVAAVLAVFRQVVFDLVTRVSQFSGTDWGQIVSNSISFSSILILSALGLAITFGVMRVINMAHGEMMMIGAYTAFALEEPSAIPTALGNIGNFIGLDLNGAVRATGQFFGLEMPQYYGPNSNLFWAIPTAFFVAAMVGYLMEICLIRFLYGRPLDTLLATWGVGMVLQQLVLLTFGASLKEMHRPEILTGYIAFGEMTIDYYRIFVFGVTGLCLLIVYLWFYQTSFGLKIRAVVQNRSMASAVGISTRKIDSITFAFATGLAGVAGCCLAHLYTTKYNMGGDYIVEAFMTVILGGMGQLAGSVGGGVLIGSADSFLQKLLNGNVPIARMLVLVAVVAFLLARPAGLFVTKERSYE